MPRPQAVPQSQQAPDPNAYCQVIAQARIGGYHEVSVMGVPAGASATSQPYIAVRVGRILLYVENREALLSLTAAWRRVLDLADGVFAPGDDIFTEVAELERRRFERSLNRS
jgi:hypothetical protein